MKKMLGITFLLIIGMCFVVWKSVNNDYQTRIAPINNSVKEYKCGKNAPRSYLFLESKIESVRRLGELEGMCESDITDKVLVRTYIPSSKELASIQSAKLSSSLLELKDMNLKPIIFLEVSPSWGSGNFSSLAAGVYNTYITDFLSTIYDSGIRDEDIYGWVIIPRPNLPYWNKLNIAPSDFKKYYLILYEDIRKMFPGSDIGVFFSSSTYQEAPIDWSERDYRSLVPYITDIPKEKITILGIDGYPSIPSVGSNGGIVINPAEYLPKFMIEELNSLIKAKKIVIGTNTFAALETEDKEKTVYMPVDVRRTILNDVIKVMRSYKLDGAEVSLLVGNPSLIDYKSVDWEYFSTQFNQDTKNKAIFIDFLRELYKNNINLIYSY